MTLCLLQERQAALEKMGISVQTSGIKVEQGKYFLVNLNADPSLNELLVYYLKVRAIRPILNCNPGEQTSISIVEVEKCKRLA